METRLGALRPCEPDATARRALSRRFRFLPTITHRRFQLPTPRLRSVVPQPDSSDPHQHAHRGRGKPSGAAISSALRTQIRSAGTRCIGCWGSPLARPLTANHAVSSGRAGLSTRRLLVIPNAPSRFILPDVGTAKGAPVLEQRPAPRLSPAHAGGQAKLRLPRDFDQQDDSQFSVRLRWKPRSIKWAGSGFRGMAHHRQSVTARHRRTMSAPFPYWHPGRSSTEGARRAALFAATATVRALAPAASSTAGGQPRLLRPPGSKRLADHT